MELFNSRRWMGLTSLLATTLCLLLSACNSTEEEPLYKTQQNALGEVISLSNGEMITLSDTTTYEIFPEDLSDVSNLTDKASENLFDNISRSTNSLRAYGYDSQEPETDWKKYLLNSSWEKYGVTPAIYVGRYVKVHKNLSIEPGTYAVPADYTSDKAPKNAMGWDGTTGIIGFTPTNKSDYISDGVTRIFIINCDMSGRVYNKNIPANPSNFEWAYKMESKVDIWD